MVSVEIKQIKVRGRTIDTYVPVIEQSKDESIIVQNDAYTIKELFQRHLAGNQITAGTNVDSGNGAATFEEMSPLDYLEGDLTDLDTINGYIEDYQNRVKQQKQEYYDKQQRAKQQAQQQANTQEGDK